MGPPGNIHLPHRPDPQVIGHRTNMALWKVDKILRGKNPEETKGVLLQMSRCGPG